VGDQIDTEVRRVLDEALKRAREALEGHRQQVDQVARLLMDKEQLDGDELRRILDTPAS